MANLNTCRCGAKPDLHEDFWPYEDPHPMHWVMCPTCQTETKVYETQQEAVDAWNKGEYQCQKK